MPTMRARPAPLAAAVAAPLGLRITPGVDTHADVHVGVALDHLGRVLGSRAVPATRAGYAALAAWAASFGVLERIGIEGASGYGAGLTR
jgi:hypothetical protein